MAAMTDEQKSTFIEAVQSIVSFDEPFVRDVLGMLETLGYTVQDGDQFLLGFTMRSVEAEIKSACNVSSIPPELMAAAVKMVVGNVLYSKKQSGELQGFSLNFDPIVKEVQEGDTNVVFGIGQGLQKTPDQQFTEMVDWLMTCGKRMYGSYRRLRW